VHWSDALVSIVEGLLMTVEKLVIVGLAQEVTTPMEQYVCSARQALTCTTGCIWDLWPPCLLYFIGFLSTSSQRGKGKERMYCT